MAFSKIERQKIENAIWALGLVCVVIFSYGFACILSPLDETKGIGLMLATLVLQQWKHSLERKLV